MSLKIGIILNYKTAEKKKDELIKVSKYSWLSNVSRELVILRNGKPHVPADVAIGMYLQNTYSDILVDFITPREVSTQRFKKNHLNFVIIYDLVEAFHLSSPAEFKKYKTSLKNCGNVYPPYEYQKFVNNKCTYYKYLEKKGIPVAPTYCVTKEKWYYRNPKKYTSNLISKFKTNKWESVIAKPVYGQESIDFAKFKGIKNTSLTENKMVKYLGKIIPKYKSVVIQEFVKGFDSKNPEFRMYYLNGTYKYCIITVDGDVKRPSQEGGNFKIDPVKWNYLKSFTKKVVSSLPKILINNVYTDSLLLRIDVGSGLENVKYSYFINEIEFVPSLYVEDHKYPVIEELSDSLIDVAEAYSVKHPVNTVF